MVTGNNCQTSGNTPRVVPRRVLLGPLLHSLVEPVEFSLDGRHALELHVESLTNFGNRRVKCVANGFELRLDLVELNTLLLDGCTVASH